MMYFLRSCSRSSPEQLLRFQMQQLADLHRNIIERTVQIAAEPLLVKIDDPARKVADVQADHFGMTHIVRNIAVMQHMVGEHLFQLFHEELGAVDAHQWAVKVRVLLQIAAELQQRGLQINLRINLDGTARRSIPAAECRPENRAEIPHGRDYDCDSLPCGIRSL